MAAAAQALLDAGAQLLQIRWKEHFSRSLFEQAETITNMCRRVNATLVINDRADIALLLGCGLHLGQDDLPPESARQIVGSDAMVGFSTHNAVQFRAGDQEPVDYLAIGPIFETSSKVNPDPVVGIPKLNELRGFTSKPVVAIGGITRENARQVWNAGADSIAVIGGMYPEECTPAAIKNRFKAWMEIASNE
jgi:thiamine-phosphate pyrophosphorylase